MTKKDYIFFARLFGKLAKSANTGNLDFDETNIYVAVNDFCDYAKDNNPRFNATIFRRAVLEHQTNSN